MTPGELTACDIEIYRTSDVFAAGHQVHLTIGTANTPATLAPAAPSLVNQAGAIRVLHAPSHDSYLQLPVIPGTPVGATSVVIEDGVEEDMLSAIMQFTGVPSLTGLPALVVPCGFDGDGLPIGMQVIGRPFDEATLFRLGAAFQAVTEFHTRTPNFS